MNRIKELIYKYKQVYIIDLIIFLFVSLDHNDTYPVLLVKYLINFVLVTVLVGLLDNDDGNWGCFV